MWRLVWGFFFFPLEEILIVFKEELLFHCPQIFSILDWEEFVLSVTFPLMNIWLMGWNVKRAAISCTHYPPWKFQDNCGKERGGDKWWGTYWVRVYDLVGAPLGQSGPLDYSSVLIHMHSLNKCYSSYYVPITVWFIGWKQKQLNNINQNKQ